MGKKRERTEAPNDKVEMNMTPMIDIVFQLVMFFIIVTDFTQKDIALLELPWSHAGVTDEGEDPDRLIVNITTPRPTAQELADPAILRKWPKSKLDRANKILIHDREYDSFEKLAAFLEANGRGNPKYRDPDNPALSNRALLIRCDTGQAFDYVKAILQICAQPSVAIYKIEIATSEQQHK